MSAPRPVARDCLPAGTAGIVLGNGPAIDDLPDIFFKRLQDAGDRVAVCGVNRICASARLLRAGYAPDYHLIWDGPRGDGSDIERAQAAGLAYVAGRTWRLIGAPGTRGTWPHDQILPPGMGALRCSVSESATRLLIEMGAREVYLYGVQYTSGVHCRTMPPIRGDMHLPASLWTVLQCYIPLRSYMGARVYCASLDSRLLSAEIGFEHREWGL